MTVNNIYADIPDRLPDEFMENLFEGHGFRIERIVSRGHCTPPGEWYDQQTDEWVILLKGCAGLRIQGLEDIHVLNPGDYVHLHAHQKHRVEWTQQNADTVWLAIHF